MTPSYSPVVRLQPRAARFLFSLSCLLGAARCLIANNPVVALRGPARLRAACGGRGAHSKLTGLREERCRARGIAAPRNGLSMVVKGGRGKGGRGRGERKNVPQDVFTLSSEERLQKFLSHSGIDSRRQCEQMILDGRVRVNGRMVKGLGIKVDPRRDQVHVDGNRVFMRPPSEVRWIALNKPKGVICTVSDELGRPTAIAQIPNGKEMRLVPVGRLDRDSCGLILLTNENSWINPLTHPSYGHEKTYRVSITSGYPTDQEWKMLTGGMLLHDDPKPTRPCLVEIIDYDRRTKVTTVDIMIREGKNRQIRRMFEGIGHDVRSITRISHGPIRLKHLRPGEWRSLEEWEIEKLKNLTTKTLKNPSKVGLTSRIGGGVDAQGEDGSDSAPGSKRSMGHGPFSRQNPNPTYQPPREQRMRDPLDEEEDEWNNFGVIGERKEERRMTNDAAVARRQSSSADAGVKELTREEIMRKEDAKHEWISPSWAREDDQQAARGGFARKKSKGAEVKNESEGDMILRKIREGEKLTAPAWEGGGRVDRASRKTDDKKQKFWVGRGKGSWSKSRS